MNLLRTWRFKKNLSIQEVAKKLHISYVTAWKYDNGISISERMVYYIEFQLKELEKEEGNGNL